MFVVTGDGVVATDPINPTASKVYLEEIRKITPAPIRYVIYSHHHSTTSRGAPPSRKPARPSSRRLIHNICFDIADTSASSSMSATRCSGALSTSEDGHDGAARQPTPSLESCSETTTRR